MVTMTMLYYFNIVVIGYYDDNGIILVVVYSPAEAVANIQLHVSQVWETCFPSLLQLSPVLGTIPGSWKLHVSQVWETIAIVAI